MSKNKNSIITHPIPYHPIGEPFLYNGEWIEAKTDFFMCEGCIFIKNKKVPCNGNCTPQYRIDGRSVVYVKSNKPIKANLPQLKNEEMKEYKLGQILTINGTKCRVTKKSGCKGCIFGSSINSCTDIGDRHKCGRLNRSDGNHVIFKPIYSVHAEPKEESSVISNKGENIS